jgi:predicted RNA-binding Zn-ribbon protein involved in translation (DUF1610 family)
VDGRYHRSVRALEACPSCGAVAWYRDGVTIVASDAGALVARRVMPSALPAEDWSCAECGREIGSRLPLARRLNELSDDAEDAIGRTGFVA